MTYRVSAGMRATLLPHRLFCLAFVVLAALGLGAPAMAADPPPPPRAAMADLAALAPVTDCAKLAKTDLVAIAGGPVTLAAVPVPGAHAYCRVTGTIAPALRFEVRLPLKGWTQRLLQTGCGGLCGNLRIDAGKADGCTPVTDGAIVLAATDMGHQGMDMAWGANPRQREDFAYRGVHVTALVAKALTRAFYGRDPRYSYFSGCSDGGREALIEAQRFPQDFDGIAAGAPALHFTLQNSFHHAWLARTNTAADGQPILVAADLPLLHRVALDACDRLDGLVDGQIDDPRRCHVDPAVAACKDGYQPGRCLTAAKVAAGRAIYAGARSADGQALEVGPLQPGSELGWLGVFVPFAPGAPMLSAMIADQTINHLLAAPGTDPGLTPQTFPFTVEALRAQQAARALYDADDVRLDGFAARGGKLILWHGWADPHISPLNTIDYFDRAGMAMGRDRRDAILRLFLFPGMGHCSGGDGPNDFPLLSALMAWVEQGRAPDVMIAHRAVPTMEGQPLPAGAPGMMTPPMAKDAHMPPPPSAMVAGMGLPGTGPQSPRSRPVYAYPIVARYGGSGSIDEAKAFGPAAPAEPAPAIIWGGGGER